MSVDIMFIQETELFRKCYIYDAYFVASNLISESKMYTGNGGSQI